MEPAPSNFRDTRSPRRAQTFPVRFEEPARPPRRNFDDMDRGFYGPSPPQDTSRGRFRERVIERERERNRSRDLSSDRSLTPSPPPQASTRERAATRRRSLSPEPEYYNHNHDLSPYSRRSRVHGTNLPNPFEPTSYGDYLDVQSTTDVLESASYSFSLSRYSKTSQSVSGSISDSSEKESAISEHELTPSSNVQPGKVVKVWRSQYVGDGLIGGVHTVKLTTLHGADQKSKKNVSPLFKWIHCEDPSMDFETFHKNVLRTEGLTENKRNGVSRLLTRIAKKYDKPIQMSRGIKAKYMVPLFLQDVVTADSRQKGSRTKSISWMCVPYFKLQKYFDNSVNIRPGSHPMKTLLQARFSMVKKQRDMQQAVCNLPDNLPEHCFYIAQVWLLIIDDSLIISCGTMPMEELQRNSMLFPSDPLFGPVVSVSRYILVSTGRSILWSLPTDECQTWFAFIAHFLEYWPSSFKFSYNEKTITSEDWPRILAQSGKTTVRLHMSFIPAKRLQSKGLLHASVNIPEVAIDSNSKVARDDGAESETKAPEPIPINAHSAPPSQTSRLRPEPQRATLGSISPKAHDRFHLFHWLNAPTIDHGHNIKLNTIHSDKSTDTHDSLLIDLGEIDDFLSQKTRIYEGMRYQAGVERSRIETYTLLSKESQKLKEGRPDFEQAELQRYYQVMLDLVNAAELLFQFFLQPEFVGPTVGKYWGAVYDLIEYIAPTKKTLPQDERRRKEMEISGFGADEETYGFISVIGEIKAKVSYLETLAQQTQQFSDLVCLIAPSERSQLVLPEELTKAWLHLLMSLIFLKDQIVFENVFRDQIDLCRNNLEQGTSKVVRSLSITKSPLSQNAVFAPSQLASLISLQLTQDVTGGAFDINETYGEYLSALESKIESAPLDRGHQDKITLLKQEISVINETLNSQRRILSQSQPVGRNPFSPATRYDYVSPAEPPHHRTSHAAEYYSTAYINPDIPYSRSRSYGPERYHATTREPPQSYNYMPTPELNNINIAAEPSANLDPRGIQGLLSQESMMIVEKRIRDFKEMEDRANDLETWNIQKIDSNKDRQEAAIYVFTIVTVIFLPLSTVASILGMNTNDVRNMGFTQWVFWATALPLTALVILVCAVWSGEGQGFWERFGGFWRRGGGRRGRREEYTQMRNGDVGGYDDDYDERVVRMARRQLRSLGRERDISY